MVYALIGDEILEQLEALGLSRDAMLLHIEGMVHCSRHLTDGLISIHIRRISSTKYPNKTAQELTDAGVWETTEDGGYLIKSYLDHQRSSDEVLRERERLARNKQHSRQRKQLHDAQDHSLCVYKSKACPIGELDWNGQVVNSKSENVTDDTSRPIQSNTLQSEPKARIGEDKAKEADAIAFTPKGRERYASVMKEVHIFVDKKLTGICYICGDGEKSNSHQKKIPNHFQAFANATGEIGIPWEYVPQYDEMKSPDRDAVSSNENRINYIQFGLDYNWNFFSNPDDEFNEERWFSLIHRVMLLAAARWPKAELAVTDSGNFAFRALEAGNALTGDDFVWLLQKIESLIFNPELLDEPSWLADPKWLENSNWSDNYEWLSNYCYWIRSDAFLQAAQADTAKYANVLEFSQTDKVQAYLNRGQARQL